MRWTRSGSSEPPPAPRRPDPGGFWEGVRRVLPAVRGTMEFCWLFPWLAVLDGVFFGAGGPLLPAGWTLLLLLGGQAAVRPALARAGSLPRARALLVGTGVVLGFAAVHGHYYATSPLWHPAWVGAMLRAAHDTLPGVSRPAAGALLAALLWWRGLALGMREVGPAEIEEAYKTGAGMIVLYFLAAAVYPDSRAFAAAGPLPGSLPAFFFLGLSALALARLGAIWERGRPDERALFPARAWLLLVVGVVGMILLAASMTAGLAAADVSTYLGLALRPLLPVLEVLFLVLFFVAGLIVRVLLAVLSRIPRREVGELRTPPSVFDDLLRRLRELEVNPEVVEGARWGMVLGVLVLLVAGMALSIVLLRGRERKTDEDEHESVWSTRDALRGLAGLLPRWGRRDAYPAEMAGPAGAVRRIYRELLRLGAGLGAARAPWATPREHRPRLGTVLPGCHDEVTLLTDAYERARYGRWRPTAEEVRAAEEALARARAASEARSR